MSDLIYSLQEPLLTSCDYHYNAAEKKIVSVLMTSRNFKIGHDHKNCQTMIVVPQGHFTTARYVNIKIKLHYLAAHNSYSSKCTWFGESKALFR